MDDEELYLDDEEDGGGEYVIDTTTTDEDDDAEERAAETEAVNIATTKQVNEAYKTSNLTEAEVKLIQAYDAIYAVTKTPDQSDEQIMSALAFQVLSAMPVNTSTTTVVKYVNDFTNKQGRQRMTYGKIVEGNSLGESSDEDDDVNRELSEKYQLCIERFIEYLANRDMSKDSKMQINRKQRHIPALLIFLFSIGAQGWVEHCDTLPPVYKRQVDNALKKLLKMKFELVEELAKEYDSIGHKEMAKMVRKKQLEWFDREPGQLREIVEYKPILTDEDVKIYKKIRPKYMNITRAITQDVASDLILVCTDEKKLIFTPMKDKTRAEAIEDMKAVWADWAKDNMPEFADIVEKIVWKH